MLRPCFEVAPFLSEKIHVEDVPSSFTTPIARNEPRVSDAAAAPAAPSAGPLAADVDLPMFTAPVYVPEVKSAETVKSAAEDCPRVDFVPSREMMSEVDEKVVAAEKAAVRDLLDVKDAAPLEKFVNVSATSASQGEWIYFRVRINPRTSLRTVPKDVVVILDASGSIGGDRLQSCRDAAKRILRSAANTGDRFNLVAFRDRFSYAFRSWQECTKATFSSADRWLSTLAAYGRTDVFATIRSVLTLPRDPKRPLIALVVTDGDANAGVSETSQILSKFTSLNDGLVSVYMYGVKKSANRELIDILTHGNRGESFIFEGSRWNAGEGIEGLSERFRDPVLSDLRVVFTSVTKAEAYPRLLRNLYRGEIVDVVGRVPRDVREIAFSLKGLNGDKSYEGFFRLGLAQTPFDPTIPDAWRREQAIDARLR
ncbi:MAG: VWA domain-containing protein [Kiritimatiellae bacterium]|nr:VWA domain-containing protein [Kiritimatiellia bacterium]